MCNSLNELDKGLYRNCYYNTGLKGIPYYITKCDTSYYVAQIDTHSGICEIHFNENDEIIGSSELYYFEDVSYSSEIRKRMQYPITYKLKEIGNSIKFSLHNLKTKFLEKEGVD